MNERPDLFKTNRWVYWLDKSHPGPDPGTYRVSVVVEDESGHFPTGGGEKDPLKAPWYWDDETCKQVNAERGYDDLQAHLIVCSSMRQQPLRRIWA